MARNRRAIRSAPRTVLLSLKQRAMNAPQFAVGDGALGFRKALWDVLPEPRGQSCWVHTIANVLGKQPRGLSAWNVLTCLAPVVACDRHAGLCLFSPLPGRRGIAVPVLAQCSNSSVETERGGPSAHRQLFVGGKGERPVCKGVWIMVIAVSHLGCSNSEAPGSSQPDHCADGKENEGETDIDCGAGVCAGCGLGACSA